MKERDIVKLIRLCLEEHKFLEHKLLDYKLDIFICPSCKHKTIANYYPHRPSWGQSEMACCLVCGTLFKLQEERSWVPVEEDKCK